MSRTKWIGAGMAVVALLAIIYSPAVRRPFLFDDVESIEANTSIQRLTPISVPLRPPRGTTLSGRPLVNLTLAMNYAVSGTDSTVSYHLTNLLLHAIAGLLLFGVLRRTIRGQSYDAEWAAHADGIAGLITVIWLLHPIQSEAVNYVVQRTEIIASICYLGVLYAWIRGWDAPSPRRSAMWRSGAVAICVLGMLSKEVMISAPIAVILYDRAFRVGTWTAMFGDRRAVWYVGLFASIGVLAAEMAGGGRSESAGFGLGMPWFTYAHTQAWAIVRYLQLTLLPSRLNLDYGTAPITGFGATIGLVALPVGILATLWAWTRAARWGWMAFVGSMFFLLLGPSSSIVPIVTEVAAERRFYLALAPTLIAIVALIDLIVRRTIAAGERRVVIVFFACAVSMTLAATTFVRSTTYATDESIWRDATEKKPDNARAFTNLGYVIADQGGAALIDAATQFRAAIALDSNAVGAWTGLTRVYGDLHQPDSVRAVGEAGLRHDPANVTLLSLLGRNELDAGDANRAAFYYEAAARAVPTVESWSSLGSVLRRANEFARAKDAYVRAIALNPTTPDPFIQLATLSFDEQKWADAIPVLQSATQRFPTIAQPYALLALAFAESGGADGAATAAASASGYANGDPGVLGTIGHAMVRARRGADAEKYLTQALNAGPPSAPVMIELARAEVMLGHRDRALDLVHQVQSQWPGFPGAAQLLREFGR